MEFLRKYGVATTIYVPLIKAGSNDQALAADFTHTAGDTTIVKDGAAAANITTAPSAITMGNGATWKVTVSATEMQAAQIVINISDATTKAIEDQQIIIATYGNASAEHAIDLDDSVRAGLTALPNAAADAAGGLPISDAGGLDLDTLLGYLTEAVATATELAKVPKSDGTATWNATALASINAEADTALSDFFTSVANLVDLIWDEPIAGHLTAGTAGLSEALGGAALVDSTITGTPTTTTFDFTGGSTSNNFYNDQLVYILSGTGIGQVRPILSSSYSGGTTTITVDEAFIETPAASDRFAILVSHIHPKSQITADIDANSTQLAAIVADTNELQTDLVNGGRLDLILDELTTQGDTNETKLDTIDTVVDAILADTGTTIPAQISALNDLATSDILTQVNAALDAAIAELGVGAPVATPSLRTGLMLLYMMARNRVDVDTTGTDALKIYNDAGTQIASKAITDDGTDYSESEMA